MIQRSFELANIAYAFNIHMTEAKEFFYLPKNDALKCCESLGASQVILRDDYLRNDYTIYVYRKPLKPALT